MKRIILAAAIAGASLATSACVIGPTASQNQINTALADKFPHCSITGSVAIGAGGLAATGTGFANTMQLNCPGEPYAAASATPAATTP